MKDGNFYSADITDCVTRDDIIFCQQSFEDRFSPSITEISCLNGQVDVDDCKLSAVECKNKMVFIKAGALVFSKNDVLAMRRSETSKLEIVSQNNKWSYSAGRITAWYKQTGGFCMLWTMD